MKNLVYLLFTALLLASCEINYYETDSKKDDHTEKQKEARSIEDPNQLTKKQLNYLERVKKNTSTSNVILIKWKDNKTLEMYFDSENLVVKDDNDLALKKANIIAEGYASEGLLRTEKDICVYIYNEPSSEVLAKSCATKE